MIIFLPCVQGKMGQVSVRGRVLAHRSPLVRCVREYASSPYLEDICKGLGLSIYV